MKWVGESKTCSRESIAKGLAKGSYNLNKSSGWFLTPLKLKCILGKRSSVRIVVLAGSCLLVGLRPHPCRDHIQSYAYIDFPSLFV